MHPAQSFLSMHVFYNVVESRPLLVDCIDPLLTELQDRGLIDRYFFIRYWLGGTHVRLRLLPSTPEAEERIRSLAEPRIYAFLNRRPSFFSIDPEKSQAYMRQLFESEYGAEAFERTYGIDGRMPVYPNNSIQYISYEPEYDRYGGPSGVALAEQHFQFSSAFVLRILRETNSHIKSALLGQAMQLMLNMGRASNRNPESLKTFFYRYSAAWRREYLRDAAASDESYEAAFRRQKRKLTNYLSHVELSEDGRPEPDHDLLEQWYWHCVDLRNTLADLYARGDLPLVPAAESEEDAVRRVFIGYMHMTNNRLGVRIVDESYLAYILSRAVEEGSCMLTAH